jgi:uncharacterized protein YabE (DUF348 family)/3D (Asp-Asp-Asp) domain-containing protein
VERSKKYSKKHFPNGSKAAMFIVMALVIVSITIFNCRKQVTVAFDGKEYKIVTLGSTYAKASESRYIVVGSDYKAVSSLDSTTKVTKAMNVNVSVDGRSLYIGSTEDNVGDMLKAEGIKLSKLDKVSPSRGSKLKDGLEIKVERVKTADITKVSAISYGSVNMNDSSMLKGVTKVVQNGQQGEKKSVARVVYENGKEVSRKLISETVTKKPVRKIVATGTASPAKTTVSIAATAGPAKTTSAAATSSSASGSRGLALSYSKVLTVKATAYSSEEIGMGTITASGATVVRNPNGYSTIAVDPSVIPMGTKVYVAGYGYAIAADTGSAIKGNIIDLYLNTISECNIWGARTVNVYILK